ncbi:hypothetical protein [Amycolatopsis suaedae]|uniref:Helix-turn-helix domain-containing protein n=1 Tax=Amycolatopsis suaedae TaxID=2510978 RepID=A0A4Q7J0C8_9PSEU|nr:hypothetical protein [Amycolatopsis suaedae]RZQ59826.1 hypothetical protein EWH70_32440 [Amycolatopsis suaedae]
MNHVRPCLLGCTNADGIPYRAAPGRQTCPRCGDQLAALLREIGDLYAVLDDPEQLLPTTSGGRGRPGYGSRSPAVDDLIVHTDVRTGETDTGGPGALAVVEQWARQIREDRSVDTPPDQMRATVPAGRITMTRELATLRFHWDWILAQDWVDAFADEMRAVRDQLVRARRLTVPVIRIGTCPITVMTVDRDADPITLPCSATLRVRLGDTEIRCPACHTVWTRDRWHQLGTDWADYASLATQLDIPVTTLRRWCHEDHWATAGTRSRRLVSRADALASYARRHTTPTGNAG